MSKAALRQQMLARRRALNPAEVLRTSLAIQQRLADTPEFCSAETVALYSPILNEVFTEELFRKVRGAGKQAVFPRVHGEELEFLSVADMDELDSGAFGILEPVGGETLDPGRLDLVIIPGLAFDPSGLRLGFGRGFYDRVLHRCRPEAVLVGLAFDWQLLEELPSETHDVAVDIIVTEERLLRTTAGTGRPGRHRSLQRRRFGP